MKTLALVALAAAFLYWVWQRIRSPRPKYAPLAIPPDDPLMLAAVERARATLPEFRGLLAASQGTASVKCPLVTSSGTVEHVWAEVLEHAGNQVKVRLVTPPVTHTGPLERLHTKSLDELEDWQVTLPDGKMRGGFTMRVMFTRGREHWGSLPPELEELERKYGVA